MSSVKLMRPVQGSDLQITDAVTEAKSLPVRHVRTDVDEVQISLLFAVLPRGVQKAFIQSGP